MSFYVGTLDKKGVINAALAKEINKKPTDLKFETKNCPGLKGSSVKVNVFEVTPEELAKLTKSIWRKSIYFYESATQNPNDVQLFDVCLSKTTQV
jgi:hypothetical protein